MVIGVGHQVHIQIVVELKKVPMSILVGPEYPEMEAVVVMEHVYQKIFHAVLTIQLATAAQKHVAVRDRVHQIIQLAAEIEIEAKEVIRVQIVQEEKDDHHPIAQEVNRAGHPHTALPLLLQVPAVEEVRVDRVEVQAVPAAQIGGDKYHEAINSLSTIY